MDDATAQQAEAALRAGSEPMSLAEALRVVCEGACGPLGWTVALYLMHVEASRLCCLVAASGIAEDQREILLGAALGSCDDLRDLLDRGARVGPARVFPRLGEGTALALAGIAGAAIDRDGPAGYVVAVPVEGRRTSGVLVVYDVGATEPPSPERARLVEMAARHAATLVDLAPTADVEAGGSARSSPAWDEVDERVARALARSNLAVVLLDADGCARWANEAGERLFGPALIPFAHAADLVESPDRERVDAAVVAALGGASRTLTVRSRFGRRDLVVDLSPSHEGSDATVLLIAHDAPEIRPRGPAASRANLADARSAVARRAAWEVASLVAQVSSDPSAVAPAQPTSVAWSLFRMAQTRQDRLAEPLDLDRIVADAVEATSPLCDEARTRGIVYDIRFEPCGRARTLGSADELRSLFVELLKNALEAQPAGGTVEIKTVERSSIVGAQIRDGGPGFADEARARAAEPFFTTKGASREGLGLALASAVAVRHGGRLGVRGDAKGGAIIHVLLPSETVALDRAMRPRAVVLAESVSHRIQLVLALERAAKPAIWVVSPHELVRAVGALGPETVAVDEQALLAHGRGLEAVLGALAPETSLVVVARTVPDWMRPLLARPSTRLLDPRSIEGGVTWLG